MLTKMMHIELYEDKFCHSFPFSGRDKNGEMVLKILSSILKR
jgi:hypothetical protein